MAGPAPGLDEPEPDTDTRLQLISVPADSDVSNSVNEFQPLFDYLKVFGSSSHFDGVYCRGEHTCRANGSSYVRIPLKLRLHSRPRLAI